MDVQHLSALLELAGIESEDNWSVLSDERTLTLHAASAGVGLNVSKVRKVRIEGAIVFAETVAGDTYVLHLEDVFAGSVDPPQKSSRKAGFR